MWCFGVREAPLLEYRHEDLDRLAEKVIRAQTSLTGVQPKLSLNLDKHEGTCRLTIVGLWGDYILKPQTESYPQLPENEDLTMHLAEAAKISVKDKEELALPLSGRKSQLQMNDFLKSATAMGLEQNVVINLIENMHKAVPKWRSLIQSSFLTADMKEKYEQLVMLRLDRLHV